MSQQSSTKNFTRGGQITFHNLRMLFQINKTVGNVYAVLFLLLTGGIFYLITPTDSVMAVADYLGAKASVLLGDPSAMYDVPYLGQHIEISAQEILRHEYFQSCFELIWGRLVVSVAGGVVSSFIGIALVIRFLAKRGGRQTNNQFIRGAVFEAPESVIKRIAADNKASSLHLDGFPLIKNTEVQHLLVHGTIGSGKSQLIMKVLDAIKSRGDQVIIYDKGCGFISHYYREECDIILNPFDKRCANWDLWSEARTQSDFDNMAESLIPMHGETDPFWVNAARTVFSSIAYKMRGDKARSLDKLLALILTGELEMLEAYLKGTPAAILVSGKIEKTAISIRSVITTYLKSLQTLAGLDEGAEAPFSIRDWVQSAQKGWLFISSNGEQHSSLKPLISMWLAMASMTLLSLPEDRDRRIWFICDELPSLHKLPMLGETIAEVRKFGGCFLLGMQSFSQLEKVYGRGGSREIFDLLNSRFFFRSPSSEMAQLVSRELGQEEVEDTRENYSYGANTIRDGISLGRNRLTRPLVTYPEVMDLKDMRCYVRLPGNYPITQLTLRLELRDKMAPGVIRRDMPSGTMLSNKKQQSSLGTQESTQIEPGSLKKRKNIGQDALTIEV